MTLSFPCSCNCPGGVIRDTSIVAAPKILVVQLLRYEVREPLLLFFIYYNFSNLTFTCFLE
jgi:phosphate starvation-inducible membrane PsiE